jgi:hypothetical protein
VVTDLARQTDEQRTVAAADPEQAEAALLHYLGTGDLSQLTGEQRKALYKRTCDSLGINSLTRPFEWVEFYDPETKGKKLVLYPRAACADQLAYQHRIRVEVLEEKIVGTLFKVEMRGHLPNGRTETNVAYLDLTDRDGKPLRGQRLGNAYMKARTKAKRRLVFGMVGMMAPPDVEDLQQVRVVTVDGSGNVIEAPTEEQRYLAETPRAARAIGEPIFEDVDPDAVIGPATGAHQRPRAEDLEHPKREGPRPSFRASDEDVKRWCGAWFAIVDETPWDTKEQRAVFVANWTATVAEWPEAKRTDSLRTMFVRCTSDEAGFFLSQARAMVDTWREGQAAEEAGEPDLGSDVGLTPEQAAEEVARQEAHDGRPMADLSDEEIENRFEQGTERLLGRPRADDQPPTRTELVTGLRAMIAEVRSRGGSVDVPDDLTSLTDDEIEALTNGLAAKLQPAF